MKSNAILQLEILESSSGKLLVRSRNGYVPENKIHEMLWSVVLDGYDGEDHGIPEPANEDDYLADEIHSGSIGAQII